MKIFRHMLFAAVFWSVSGPGSLTAQDDTAGVREAVLAFGEAYAAADAHELGELLVTDYIHVNGTSGSVLDRESWLGWIRQRRLDMDAGRLVIEQYQIQDLQIRVRGTAAVVVGSVRARERRAGEMVESRVRFTNVWLQVEQGVWRRAAFHDSPLND